MTTPNPFVFQGLPSGGPGNPLLQSLDMMRQAWSSLTPGAGLPTGLAAPIPLDPSEIDRRIAELQAVENWLTLNLTMLQGSIRALEVQRATIATLRSFANLGGQAASAGTDRAPDGPSPLEVALGLKPAPANDASSAGAAGFGSGLGGVGGGVGQGASPAGLDRAEPAASAEEPGAADSGAAATAGLPPMFTDPGQAAAAQQAWWNLLQQQFQQIAGAAAATFPAATPASSGSSGSGSSAKAAAASPPPAAKRSTAPRKAAPRKAAPAKAAAKPARKTPAAR